MKTIFFFLLAMLFNTAIAQNFQQTVKLIQDKISCCAVPLSTSSKNKVDSINIDAQGNITLNYSNKAAKEYFNLFKLFNGNPTSKGIDTLMGGKFIQFYISEKKIRLIRFKTAADAAEVYKAFFQLLSIGKTEQEMFSDLDLKQTVDVINIRLSKWTEKANTVKLNAAENGNILLSNGKQLIFSFNIFDLVITSDERNEGIKIIPCDFRTHAPSSYIHFNSHERSLAFVRFTCLTPEAELDIIKSAFIHLKRLCKK